MQKIITRLSFNTKGWQEPSGPLGKSKNQIHEHVYGFGFEEWLFNKEFVDKDGYHFGYIEGIHRNYKQGDSNYPLELFTIDKRTRRRTLVAILKKWNILSPTESSNLIANNIDWIDKMKGDLRAIGNANAINKFNQHLNNRNGYQLFNIKFKDWEFVNKAIPSASAIYKMNRFWLHRV
jgi:hypothetical protein